MIRSRLIILFLLCVACNYQDKQDTSGSGPIGQLYPKGSFGYDVQFLSTYYNDLVILSDGNAQLVISPGLQGRVMTSTAGGMDGISFGWINYDLIASGQKLEHFNPVGGEERFWLGPEGGQYSIFFKPGSEFIFENWFVPEEIDTEPFQLKHSEQGEARFERSFQLVNYQGNHFDIKVERKIKLLEIKEIEEGLEMSLSQDVLAVGYESENVLTNSGQYDWTMETGMLSIWILNMFKPSSSTFVIVPFRKGDVTGLGKIVTDDYFGKVPPDRLSIADGIIFFKADGKMRSKIGISPQRAFPVAGSFDAENNILTVVQYSLNHEEAYVNSLWEHQEEPFAGDAFNAYNDGPLESGDQLGPFYELESSSPATRLRPGESHVHIHRTMHFEGSLNDLNTIMTDVFGVNANTVMARFQ